METWERVHLWALGFATGVAVSFTAVWMWLMWS